MISVALNGAEVRTLKNNTTGMELNVIAARGMIFSSWRPSREEMLALNAGKPVWVVIRGELVPEFTLAVGDRNEVVPPEIIRRAQRQDAIIKSEEGQAAITQDNRKRALVEVIAWLYLAGSVAAVVGGALIIWRLLGR